MRSRLSFFIGAAVMLGHVALFILAVRRHTGGSYSYPIDDAFIHLAIAKHLAFDGVYGVTRYAFAAASSSVLWPLLLAAIDKVAGDHVVTPLILNMIAGVLVVWATAWALRAELPRSGLGYQSLVCLAVATLTPLPTLVATGMEHTLQTLTVLLLVVEAARVISTNERPSLVRLAAFTALASAVRYEALFAVAVVAALAAVRKKWRVASGVVVAGALPVLAFGAYSIAHGGLLLPNSVLLKGRHFVFHSYLDVIHLLALDLLDRLSAQPHLLVLLLAILGLYVDALRRGNAWTPSGIRLFIAGAVTLLHLEFANVGWFFRYEAYLVALDLLVVALAAGERLPSPLFTRETWKKRPAIYVAAAVAAFAFLGPLVNRAIAAADQTPLACRNIFQQQVQTARFLARYFAHEAVAVNDIGAPGYFGDERIIDLLGLASMDVARAKKMKLEEAIPKADFARLTDEAKVAVIYDEWLADRVPSTWVRLGRWRIEDDRSCAFPDVGIYATHVEDIERVLAALEDFAPSLPKLVHQEGRYTDFIEPDDGGGYRLRSGDTVEVVLDGLPEPTSILRVEADGSIYPPKIGEVHVRGSTVDGASDLLAAKIEKARRDSDEREVTRGSIHLLEKAPARIYTVGHVRRSSELLAFESETAEFALGLAGGASAGGRLDRSYVLREDPDGFHELPLRSPVIVGRNDPAFAPVLRERDIVVVP